MPSSRPANLNAWWCRDLLDTLVACGLREVVTCPGNRNVPLLFACAEHPAITCHSHVDERSGAFLALGLALASGRPTAICTTSGSAVANLLPAIAEAHHAGVTVIALTADRPPELQDCEAPQTTRQPGLFGPYCPDPLVLEVPSAEVAAVERTRHAVRRLLHRAGGASPGPAHIDVPLRDPLPPQPDPDFAPPALPAIASAAPAIERSTVEIRHGETPLSNLRLAPGLRGVIVSGVRNPLAIAEVAQLAERTGFPVLADHLGHGRDHRIPNLVTTGDALLGGPLRDLSAELVIRLGPAPLARPCWEWLQAQHCPVLRIARQPVAADFCHRRFETLVRPNRGELERLAAQLASGEEAWREHWLQAERAAASARAAALADAAGECAVVADALARPEWTSVLCANSMPVRHANLVAPAQAPARCHYANRGLDGIDGSIGSFCGLLHHGGPGLAIVGDLAFQHDLPGLAAARAPGLNGCILVLDNGGGAIFDLLPVAELPAYRELVRTPQALDCAAAAAAFGLETRSASNRTDIAAAIAWSAERSGVQVIHARLGEDGARDYRELLRHLAAAAG